MTEMRVEEQPSDTQAQPSMPWLLSKEIANAVGEANLAGFIYRSPR